MEVACSYARVYCVKFGIFTFTFHFAGMAQVIFQPSRDMTWHTLIKQRYDIHHRTVAISAGAKRPQKVPRFFELLPLPYEKLPFLFCGKRAKGEQNTGASEYFGRNTRVLQ